MSIEFLITVLIAVVMPSTAMLYTLVTALTRGGRTSVVAAFGCTLGIVPHIAAAIFGIAALLHASALAFEVVRWAGIAYLLYLAFLPQFVVPGTTNVVPQMLGLSAVFMLLTFVVFVTYGLMAPTMRNRVLSSPRAMASMRRLFAGAFATLAARLALTER